MANEGDALLREVDDELRRDQLLKLWNEYGTYLIAAAALLVLGVAGYKAWESRRQSAIEAAGAHYSTAIELAGNGKSDEAQQALATLAKDGSSGYATLARLRLAGDAAKAGRSDEALAAYDALGKDSRVDQIFRDYARLQSAALKLDSADWTQMQNQLTDLVADKNPWRYSARELMGLAAFRAQLFDQARQMLGALAADQKAPGAIGERAKAVLAMIAEAELAKAAPASVEPTKGAAAEATAVTAPTTPAGAAGTTATVSTPAKKAGTKGGVTGKR